MSIQNQSKNMRKALLLTVFSIFLLSFVSIGVGDIYYVSINATNDTYVRSNQAGNNFASAGAVVIQNDSTPQFRYGYFEWDLTEIPIDNVEIINATFYGWVSTTSSPPNDWINTTFHEFYEEIGNTGGYNWSVITWDNQPCGSAFDNSTGCNLTYGYTENKTLNDRAGHNAIRLDDMVQLALNNDRHFGLVMRPRTRTGATGGSYSFSSIEQADETIPRLDITYDWSPVYNFTVWISGDVYHNGTEECYVFFQNWTIVEFGGQRFNLTDNATFAQNWFCEDDTYPIYEYVFQNIEYSPSEVYQLNITKSGYKDYTQVIDFETDRAEWVILTPIGKSAVILTVQNSTGVIEGARVIPYFENGTAYKEGIYPTMRLTDSNGQVNWDFMPVESYYFLIEEEGHEILITELITITDDTELTYTLTTTDRRIVLSCNETAITTVETLHCEANYSGFGLPPFALGSIINIVDSNEERETLWRVPLVNPYNFTLYGGEYFSDGTNYIYISHDDYVSNRWYIEVTDVTGVSEVDTPFIDTGDIDPAISWVGALLSPFTIMFMALVGLSGMVEMRIRSKGAVFFACMIIGSLILSYVGIFPTWIGIAVVLLNAFILTKFVLKVI